MKFFSKKKKNSFERAGRVPRSAMVPGFAYLVIFFVLPLMLLARYSFSTTVVAVSSTHLKRDSKVGDLLIHFILLAYLQIAGDCQKRG